MKLEDSERLEILKLEMGLIQKTLDKYDDLIFRNRNWFITLWTAVIGISFTQEKISATYAIFLSVLFWFFEGMIRHQYWYKYVLRYRNLRDSFNNNKIADLFVYDLTNSLSKTKIKKSKKIVDCFFKLEPTVVYALIGILALVAFLIQVKN